VGHFWPSKSRAKQQMNADSILWAAIALSTIHASTTDMHVIHGQYTLGPEHILNIVVHQWIIIGSILGILFQRVSNIHAHLFIVSMCIVCWAGFNGCFMAQWQRDNIIYSLTDFTIIQKPKEKRLGQFLAVVVPCLFIDLYKLRGSL
jgi:hypothetical protein